MPKVYACFWFDVEDYITPESDDALKSLLDIFLERGARGTLEAGRREAPGAKGAQAR